jgi:hypothetical protein
MGASIPEWENAVAAMRAAAHAAVAYVNAAIPPAMQRAILDAHRDGYSGRRCGWYPARPRRTRARRTTGGAA